MSYRGVVYRIKKRVQQTSVRFARIRHRLAWGSFYSQFIGSGDLCFDVGAHVGNKADIMLQLGAQVICIEPQPALVQALHKRFDDNPNVHIVPKGLASTEGQLGLSVNCNSSTLSTFSPAWKSGRFASFGGWGPPIHVQVTTLDRLVEIYGVPAFCKIDVEGYELDVLQGLTVPLHVLCFEFVRENLDAAKMCIERLDCLGAKKFNYALGESPMFALETWLNANAVVEVLSEQALTLDWGDIYVRFD